MAVDLILLLIAINDLRFHRISNKSLIGLIFIVVLTREFHLNFSYFFAVSALSIVAYRFCELGAGDVKLVSVIALFLTPPDQICNYWLYTSILGLLLITLHLLTFRTVKGAIALAPALCGAVLCIS